MHWPAAIAITYLAAAGSAADLKLGNLDQYKPKGDIGAPKLEGDTLWLTNDGSAVNIALSQQAQDKFASALKSCKKVDNDCFQKVFKELAASNVQLDSKYTRKRDIEDVFAIIAGLVSLIVIPIQRLFGSNEYHLPAQGGQDVKWGEDLHISGDGTDTITVTPTKPDDKPKSDVNIVKLDKPSDDAHQGFSLGENLAKNALMVVEKNQICPHKRSIEKRGGSDIFASLPCAAQAVVLNARPEGPLDNLRALAHANQVPNINPENKDLAGAARDLLNFVKDNAALLGFTDPAVMEAFADAALLIAYEALLEPALIKAVTPIKDSLVKWAASKTKPDEPDESGCPDPKKKRLHCGYGDDASIKNDCEAQIPKDDSDVTCNDGKYKGCKCSLPLPVMVTDISAELSQLILGKGSGLDDGGLKPKCTDFHDDGYPLASTFNSKDHQVYNEFCKAWSKGSKLEMVLNRDGSKSDHKPDVNSDKCSDKNQRNSPSMECDTRRYTLRYDPKDDKKDCDCKKAFAALSTCTTKKDKFELMQGTGSVDAGCGTFSYYLDNRWPDRKSYGLGSNKYAYRKAIADSVDKFCDEDAVKNGRLDKNSGSILRKYYENTVGEFSLAIDFQPGYDFKTSKDDCKAKLLGKCVDDFDANAKENPMNWKAGGTYTEYVAGSGNKIVHRVTPAYTRPPAPTSPKGHCDVQYKFVYNNVEIWGAGWESADVYSSMKKELGGCALFPAPKLKVVYETFLTKISTVMDASGLRISTRAIIRGNARDTRSNLLEALTGGVRAGHSPKHTGV